MNMGGSMRMTLEGRVLSRDLLRARRRAQRDPPTSK